MSEKIPTELALQQAVIDACGVAAGDRRPDPDARPKSIRAGHKDLNARGKGTWWYRMAYRDGTWKYFSDERLPSGTFLASDRRATVKGDVFAGELVCSHDKGGPVDAVWLICDEHEGEGGEATCMELCGMRKRRDGMLVVALPDGREVAVPDPRR